MTPSKNSRPRSGQSKTCVRLTASLKPRSGSKQTYLTKLRRTAASHDHPLLQAARPGGFTRGFEAQLHYILQPDRRRCALRTCRTISYFGQPRPGASQSFYARFRDRTPRSCDRGTGRPRARIVLRIRTYAVALARSVNVSDADIRATELAALLRNIGMLPFDTFGSVRKQAHLHCEIGAMILGAAPALSLIVRHPSVCRRYWLLLQGHSVNEAMRLVHDRDHP